MNNEKRHAIERRIIKKLVQDAIAAGYCVSHHNGEEYTVRCSRDPAAIMAVIAQTDEETLTIRKENMQRVGWVHLVYGNDGHDVIADHTDNPEMTALLSGATSLADQIAEAV